MSEPTEVRPFSNGSEADYWEWRNCERCTKRGEYDAEGVGPCAIETAVSMGRLLGTIPVEIAKRAGATISDQVDAMRGTGYCDMPKECAELDLVMVCEFITDRRKRAKPKCRAAATAVVTDDHGYRHAVCERHRRIVEKPGVSVSE